jgi:hypothetical protein
VKRKKSAATAKKRKKSAKKKRHVIPDPRTVVSVTELRTKGSKSYRLIKTTQTDPYDRD